MYYDPETYFLTEEEYKFEITALQWINQLAEDAALGMHVMAHVKETKQYFTWSLDDDDEDGLVLDKPEIEMEVWIYLNGPLNNFNMYELEIIL